jgi:putative Mg2+ transporter-C (MgtC) family protein
MDEFAHFDAAGMLDTLVRLAAAFVLGGLIGFERQYRQRNAGLRTIVLVATGAAAFVALGLRLTGHDGAVRVVSYVVSGIGFLGAGVIMKEGAQIRGLNTAATLWGTAAAGAFAGGGLVIEATLVTVLVLAANTLLRPIVDAINRQPISAAFTEALYRVHVLCAQSDIAQARDLLFEKLEAEHLPIQEIEVATETEDNVELAAILVPHTVDPEVLDKVVEALETDPVIDAATWTVSSLT